MPDDNAETSQTLRGCPFGSLVGQRAGGCRVGYGSVLFLGFGENGEKEISQRSLWSDQILWRIELNQQVLAGSEDDRERMKVAAKQINGRTLVRGETDGDSGDSLLTFSGDLTLRTFLLTSEDIPIWNLSRSASKPAIPGPICNKQEAEQ